MPGNKWGIIPGRNAHQGIGLPTMPFGSVMPTLKRM